MRGGRDKSAYIRFHRCVYKTIGWLEAERANGNVKTAAEALAQLTKVWEEEGPVGHAFEKFHRQNADSMVRRMAETIAAETVTCALGPAYRLRRRDINVLSGAPLTGRGAGE